jgi:hypothetical protein
LAVLPSPVLLLKSAPAPVAVFSSEVAAKSAPAPVAVLKLPVILVFNENQPTAVLYVPVVRLRRVCCPSAVLPPGYPPSGAGLTARAIGQIIKVIRTDRTTLIFIIAFLLKLSPGWAAGYNL